MVSAIQLYRCKIICHLTNPKTKHAHSGKVKFLQSSIMYMTYNISWESVCSFLNYEESYFRCRGQLTYILYKMKARGNETAQNKM